MDKYVDFYLASAIARATMNWEYCREDIAKYCAEEWEERGVLEHMMNEYINVDTPITTRIANLDTQNQRLLFRALTKWAGNYSPKWVKY